MDEKTIYLQAILLDKRKIILNNLEAPPTLLRTKERVMSGLSEHLVPSIPCLLPKLIFFTLLSSLRKSQHTHVCDFLFIF